MSCCKSPVCKIGCLLVTIGGLNWGLVGLGSFMGQNLNVVNLLLGSMPVVENVVYVLVGLSALMGALKMGKCKS